MYAVVRTGGKQYLLEPGKVVDIERIDGAAGDSVSLDEVLLLVDGEKVTVGRPLVAGAKVKAEIVRQHRGDKVISFKKIRRHGKEWTKGHRQSLTQLKVSEISS